MSDRLQFHEEAAASRDARFEAWADRKAAEWRADATRWASSPDDGRTMAEVFARRWMKCPTCPRQFQPSPAEGKLYRWCFTCSQASYAEGSTACAICQRRHSSRFPCCKNCQTGGREDIASLLRSVVLRRDGFACNICGTDEGQLDVHHIDPEGSAWAWNCEVLCVGCWLVLNGSKQYGALDELVWLERATAYSTYLAEYLDSSERLMLSQQIRETLGSDMRGKPRRWHVEDHGECHEIDGFTNVLDVFGREGIEVSHV